MNVNTQGLKVVAETTKSALDATPAATLAWLKASIDALLDEVRAMPEWQAVTDPAADPAYVAAAMREVYREIALYQPDVIEATIAVIGQFPRSLAAKQVRTMLIHQAAEWDHGEMAARDFTAMGGEPITVRDQLMTPTAFATAAFWRCWRTSDCRSPTSARSTSSKA